jgi:hypothetical protein
LTTSSRRRDIERGRWRWNQGDGCIALWQEEGSALGIRKDEVVNAA